MTEEVWQGFGTVMVLLLIGGYNGYRSHKAERAAKAASAVSARIEDKVGNGWAQEVIDRLEGLERTGTTIARENRDRLVRMEVGMEEQRSLLMKHLEAHASHDLTGKEKA